MRALLAFTVATLAATTLPATPAAADDAATGFTGLPSTTIHSGFGGGFDNGFRRDRRRLRGSDTVLVYDREYQGDSAWRADSFNDWWHERPNRAYPAWMLRNQDCQRQWWDGQTLRC